MKKLILTNNEVEILHTIFFPTGNVLKYNQEEKVVNVLPSPMRRYILDSNYTKKLPKSRILSSPGKFDCNFLSYGFFETLNILLEKNYDLYEKLFLYFDYIDQTVSSFIKSTINKTVLFSNNRFGEKLFTHIHLDNDKRSDTISVFFKLTDETSQCPKLILYDPLTPDSRILNKGYMDFKKLTHHEKRSNNVQYITIEDFSVIKFNASIIPHSFTYNEDLWVTLVYDHAVTENFTFEDNIHYGSSKLNIFLEDKL